MKYMKYMKYTILFGPKNNLGRQALPRLQSPFYRGENGGSKKLGDLPKVTELVDAEEPCLLIPSCMLWPVCTPGLQALRSRLPVPITPWPCLPTTETWGRPQIPHPGSPASVRSGKNPVHRLLGAVRIHLVSFQARGFRFQEHIPCVRQRCRAQSWAWGVKEVFFFGARINHAS